MPVSQLALARRRRWRGGHPADGADAPRPPWGGRASVPSVSGREQLRCFSDAIVAAQRPIRILKAINWDAAVHERFFRHGAQELPGPSCRRSASTRPPRRRSCAS